MFVECMRAMKEAELMTKQNTHASDIVKREKQTGILHGRVVLDMFALTLSFVNVLVSSHVCCDCIDMYLFDPFTF